MSNIVKEFYDSKKVGGERHEKACIAAERAGYNVHDGHISETAASMKQPKPSDDFMREKPTSDGTTFAKAQEAEAKTKAKAKKAGDA